MSPSPSAGYSGTPLVKKLGVRAGDRVKTKGAPPEYAAWLEPLPADVTLSARLRGGVNLWHCFTRSERELRAQLPKCHAEIEQDGCIWVSWPKKSSGVATDVTEDTIRKVALPMGLVDVKVCAVDATWSALKLVIRKELRKRP
ncbi:MAG: DUF3052 family protein [Planctomycetota bacterium]|jgi:hypothetical protein